MPPKALNLAQIGIFSILSLFRWPFCYNSNGKSKINDINLNWVILLMYQLDEIGEK